MRSRSEDGVALWPGVQVWRRPCESPPGHAHGLTAGDTFNGKQVARVVPDGNCVVPRQK